MLWTIVVVLFLLWLVGFIGFPAVGGSLIHILLVIAVIVLVVGLVRGKRIT
ncbi:MAG: lmo0937 family membrane protein [Ignavibacteria bacterium]|nr:lmo0937 family membrane protein [Ignavibacteria bacterium]